MNEQNLSLIFEPGGLRVLFQPIFEAVGENVRIHALEALCRGPKGTAIENADALFRYVRTMREECVVDRHCILSALSEASRLPQRTQMNINVHASTILGDCDLVNFINWSARAHEIDPARIVIEIVHQGPATDTRLFQRRIDELRTIGLKIALDDIGVGHASYRTVMDCRPDYFKIDRYLIGGVDRDHSRQAALRSIVALAEGFGSRVIAVGVEVGAEFTAVRAAGIDLVQGFLLAPPREGTGVKFEEMRAAS